MRILHVWPYYHEEIKYHVNYLAENQIRMGHQVSVVSSDQVNPLFRPYVQAGEFKPGSYEDSGVLLHRVRSFVIKGKVFPLHWLRLISHFRSGSADVVHLYGFSQPFDLFCLLTLLCRNRQVTIVGNDHSNPRLERTDLAAKFYFLFLRVLSSLFFGRLVQRVYVPNKATGALIKRRYGLTKAMVRVMPLGFEDRVFFHRPGLRNAEKKLLIGFAGKLESGKRLERLFHAVVKANMQTCTRISVVGSTENDYCRQLRQQAVEMGVDVEFRPFLSPPDLADFYNFVDVAVYPGSVSITTLEANGCGTPVVLNNSIEGLEDRVSEGKGWLFNDVEELAGVLKGLRRAKAEGSIGHAAIAQAAREFAWSRLTLRYLNDYKALEQERS